MTNLATTQTQNQSYELAHIIIHPICDLLELVLQNQSYRISMTQDKNKVSKRSPSEDSVLMA